MKNLLVYAVTLSLFGVGALAGIVIAKETSPEQSVTVAVYSTEEGNILVHGVFSSEDNARQSMQSVATSGSPIYLPFVVDQPDK